MGFAAQTQRVAEWRSDCLHSRVSVTSNKNPNDELMRRIAEISSLQEQIESTVQSLVAQHGEQNETVGPARALAASVNELKRELLQHYLECRMAEASRSESVSNN